MEIESPVVLARLPRTSHNNSPTRFAYVHKVRAGQKRKRLEICTATDGDSINIYKVQDGRISTSYPVPPNSSFGCKPCSIYTQGINGSSPTRKTYCAINQDGLRIQCFTEQPRKDQISQVETETILVNDPERDIVYLDTLFKRGETPKDQYSHDLLVLRDNGEVQILSRDLKEEKMNAKLSSAENTEGLKILCVQLVSATDARKSILKQREDILGGLDDKSSLLAVAFVNQDDESNISPAKFGVWLLDTARGVHSGSRAITPMLLHTLPHSENWAQDIHTQLDFGSDNSTLSVHLGQGLIIYDVSSFVPAITSQLSFEHGASISAIVLSNSLIASTTLSSLKVYDSSFYSIQASVNIDNNKRKRTQLRPSDSRGPVRLVAYFPQMGRIVAVKRHNIMVFDVKSHYRKSRKRLGFKGTLLIDSIGRGVSPGSASKMSPIKQVQLEFGTVNIVDNADSNRWTFVRKNLDQHVHDGAIGEFERAVVEHLSTSPIATTEERKIDDLGLPTKIHQTSEAMIRYVVSKIFHYIQPAESPPDGRLEIAFPALRLIPWLGRHGYLTCHEIERSLTLGSNSSKMTTLPSDAVTRALINADPSCNLLSGYLREFEHLGLPEVAQTVKMLLEHAIEQSKQHSQTTELAPDDTYRMIMDQQSVRVAPEEPHIRIQHESSVLSAKPESSPVSFTLTVALQNLGSFATTAISAQIRTTFSQNEILALIQFLRQQLFHGGYTHSQQLGTNPKGASSLWKSSAGEQRLEQDLVLSLDTIAKLLSGCIDATGPVGFFVHGDQDIFIENIIPDLKSEVSRALEAIEEASYLQGILRETMRYADSTSRTTGISNHNANNLEEQFHAQKPGTIVTLYSEPAAERGDIGTSAALLPLGLRADDIVSKRKARKGGGQILDRKPREILGLQARQRGEYSFERLTL